MDALERILEPFFMLCHRPQGDPPTRRDLPKVRDLLKYREALVQAFGAAFSPKPAPWAAFSKLSKAEGVQRRVLAMQAAMAAALGAGRTPLAVIATAGTTVTCAFDPLEEVAEACADHGAWMHVDGCYGASALFSPDHRHRLSGVERADSMVWNLHKMMGATQQCTALLVREPERLAACFSSGADYLFQPDKQFGEWDLGDRTFQCGRRVDALKLWLAWKVRGDGGFAARIDHAVAMADFARMVVGASDGAFVPLADTGFTNLVFLWVPEELRPLDPASMPPDVQDRLHRLAPRIKARMQREGTAMLGYQPVHGVNCFRMLVMNPAVSPGDVEEILGLIDRYGIEEWDALA